jgi:hypothetical protein
MIELDVDTSALTAAEQRMLAGLVPLLDPARDGVLRVHSKAVMGSWRLLPTAGMVGALDLLAPSGAVRASLSRPIVLGALKRMMAEIAAGAAQPRLVPAKIAPANAPTSSAAPAATKISRPLLAPGAVAATNLRASDAEPKTDPRAFAGRSDLAELLRQLMLPGLGLFELRFAAGESVRIDRGNNAFRCRGFNRGDLSNRLSQTNARWAELPDKVRPKTDETQASMGPLLFTLGVLTAKERFISGNYTELEFQIRAPVNYARVADLGRIAEAFAEFSPVADAALKLSIAPIEVLACLNGYAAIGLLRTQGRTQAPVPAPEEKPGGLFSRIKSRFV